MQQQQHVTYTHSDCSHLFGACGRSTFQFQAYVFFCFHIVYCIRGREQKCNLYDSLTAKLFGVTMRHDGVTKGDDDR